MTDISRQQAAPFTPVTQGLRVHAARTPEAPCLKGETPLSYGALYTQVARLAGHLQIAGLSEGHRLAIWTQKGPQAITAIWGALEAGLAYIPLDPSQPGERAARILAEAHPEVLVVSPDLLAHLPGPLPDSLQLVIFSDCADTAELPALPVPSLRLDRLAPVPHHPAQPQPDWIAAILFTSGSTGVPKGVQMSYRNLDAFIGWAVKEFSLGPADVIGNHASFHFDLSTFDLFAAARAGASVWPIPTTEQSNIIAISEGLKRYRVTTVYAVPSILTMLTRAKRLAPAHAPALRQIAFAGEVFPIGDLRAMAAQVGADMPLYNLYGPTETNACTFHRITPADLAADHPAPIGRPLPGQRAFIRDPETGHAVAPGEKGELVIEGTMVTPGYLNHPDPAIQRDHAAGRHATGDIVSEQPEGLVYHGRIDRIVKINGNRVELGEIEAALARHPAVAQAAVVQILGPRGAALVAFVTPVHAAHPPAQMEILEHLRDLLPRFMLPRHMKIMSDLPRTPNGKTDMRHLQRIAEDAFLPGPRHSHRVEPV
ncbi:AMP-binding protein (plasmid) [Thioclava litoralis]|uniref:AMP-binding protein n=1 Tax=Thioclava litoralis TaxID=3076557 RepID=A0ABZ1E635_9RHOB|nr:AMP-binding protein [Thioclava sp. FTW29]